MKLCQNCIDAIHAAAGWIDEWGSIVNKQTNSNRASYLKLSQPNRELIDAIMTTQKRHLPIIDNIANTIA